MKPYEFWIFEYDEGEWAVSRTLPDTPDFPWHHTIHYKAYKELLEQANKLERFIYKIEEVVGLEQTVLNEWREFKKSQGI